ncbi:MAG: hypothetical protein J07HB67_02682 [halophilic archaeon J07HB67]|nr:MAG: hypothetical protein J07HB67_02682 [halophilic archaeon J07HB67]
MQSTRAELGVVAVATVSLTAMTGHVATHPLSEPSLWTGTSYVFAFLMTVPLAVVATERDTG